MECWNNNPHPKKIVTAFLGMHVSPAKHSFGKCDRRTDRRTDWRTARRIDRQTDRRRTKWSLCVAMHRRRHKNGHLLTHAYERCQQTITETNWQYQTATKNFDYTTIVDRLRTVSWSKKQLFRKATSTLSPSSKFNLLTTVVYICILFSHRWLHLFFLLVLRYKSLCLVSRCLLEFSVGEGVFVTYCVW